ncbi:hypothetical protein [Streptococcus thoraltensis]|uniref:hypothetical protein n=1 Tax=Streptococcus thoraltensis TaxID=55085 RepID=UPI001F582D35|nr:hypothetical protein [Streptococcus thoraltensis]
MRQTTTAQLTKNMIIVDLMNQTGWPRERVVKAMAFLEADKTVRFAEDGSLSLRVF